MKDRSKLKNTADDLRGWMGRLGVSESDLQERFLRSAGPGGQNVNKVATKVCIKHIPTGIEVRCQKERSQSLNRYLARKMLLEKIEESIMGEEERLKKERHELRMKKRRRPASLKEKILEDKHKRSEKKVMRSKIREIEKI